MLWQAVRQSWPPFVLVTGLLLVGRAAASEGLFEALGARLAQATFRPRVLLVASLALVAAVTAVLNLDTSVVFLTPVLVHVARRRGLDERPFLYGTVMMSNAASLLLPGSNLTNLLVLSQRHLGAAAFGTRMLPAWAAGCTVTAAGVAFAFRSGGGEPAVTPSPALRLRTGALAVLASALLVVLLDNPALPVLAVGLAAAAVRSERPKLDLRVLALLFCVAVALGTLARSWHGPAALLESSGTWATAGIAALSAVVIDNLPAAVLLSAQPPPHPLALLVGLDLGPNLVVTGSLSAYLWWRAATSVGARPSIAAYSRLGLVLAPPAGGAALLALVLGRLLT
jgi:arsenical pump membrane protein